MFAANSTHTLRHYDVTLTDGDKNAKKHSSFKIPAGI